MVIIQNGVLYDIRDVATNNKSMVSRALPRVYHDTANQVFYFTNGVFADIRQYLTDKMVPNGSYIGKVDKDGHANLIHVNKGNVEYIYIDIDATLVLNPVEEIMGFLDAHDGDVVKTIRTHSESMTTLGKDFKIGVYKIPYLPSIMPLEPEELHDYESLFPITEIVEEKKKPVRRRTRATTKR